MVYKLCSIYKAISQWDKKSGSGWHNDYGANAHPEQKRSVWGISEDAQSEYMNNSCLKEAFHWQ